jgi:hypothetical protein
MTLRLTTWILGTLTLAMNLSANAAEGLCERLNSFLGSVAVGEARELQFRVIVGGNFKDRDDKAYGARRCEYAGYEPAKAVCEYLMTYSSLESPGYNAKTVIACISPKTRFAPGTWLYAISFAAKVGTDAHGSRVDLVLSEDQELGGVSMSIKATGY